MIGDHRESAKIWGDSGRLAVTDCLNLYYSRQVENASDKKVGENAAGSERSPLGDTQSSEFYGSSFPFMRKLFPSITTVSAWCSSRSRMAAVSVLSLLKILGHSLNARLEVMRVEPCS